MPALLAACHPAPPRDSLAAISDAEIARVGAMSFDKGAMMGKRVVLGTRQGVRVVAEYRCGDLCPEYTVRIIHFDVAPGPRCTASGGVSRMEGVPIAAAEAIEPFCEPRVIAGRSGPG